MGRNVLDRIWSDLMAAQRHRGPGRQLNATKAVGGWIPCREGGRETRFSCACDSPGVLAPERNASQPTKAPAQRMAWRVTQRRPRGHTGAVAFCVSDNNGGGGIRPQARGADRRAGADVSRPWRQRVSLCRPLPGNRTPPAGARGAA